MLSYLWVSIGGAIGSAARYWDLLPDLEEMIGGGLVTLEKTKVIHYRHQRPELE